MKAKTNIVELHFVVLLFFGCRAMVFSQSFTEDLSMTSSHKNKSLFMKSQIESTTQQVSAENQVTILQIGNLNNATVIKSANNTYSTGIMQEGQNNFIFSYKDAKSINQFIEQKGNNNVIIDFGKNKGVDVNQQFLQKGSNLNIISTGLNSISKDMTIQQTGSARTVSVISL